LQIMENEIFNGGTPFAIAVSVERVDTVITRSCQRKEQIMKRLTIFALALILGGGLWTDSRAQEDSAPTEDVIVDENGDGLDDGKVRRHRRGRFGHRGNRGLGGLTDEQKTELKATITELKDGGATSAEIRAAIDEFRGDNGLLTSDQRGELKETVSGLRESGATSAEVVDAITQFHADNGVELSEAQQTRIAEGAERAVLRAELHETVTGLKDAGASREEIRAAVEQFATDNGIEKPAGKQGRKGMRGQRGGHGKGRFAAPEASQGAE
jgi:hypothetical protein